MKVYNFIWLRDEQAEQSLADARVKGTGVWLFRLEGRNREVMIADGVLTAERADELAGRYFFAVGGANTCFLSSLLPPDMQDLAGRACRMLNYATAGNEKTGYFSLDTLTGLCHSKANLALVCEKYEEEGVAGQYRELVNHCRECECVVPDGVEVCDDCLKAGFQKIYAYHDRPDRTTPRFEKPTERAAVLHMGAEVELGYFNGLEREELVERYGETFGGSGCLFYAETDSSLEGGVEMISRPMTFAGFGQARDQLEAIYDGNGDAFDDLNGLHFHLDRRFFDSVEGGSRWAAVYIEYLIYKYWGFWARISGRKAGGFHYATDKGVRTLTDTIDAWGDNDRYYAVNTSNSGTIEIRFFGGRIKTVSDFLAVADIVQALGTWAKKTTLEGVSRATPSRIVRYIKNPERVRGYLAALDKCDDLPNITGADLTTFDTFRAALLAAAGKKRGC